jgi:O-acetyl-ADP-ribose deacetylase
MFFGKTEIILKKGDITTERVDVLVNAANSSLLGGGGVDGAIHRAGGSTILEECRKIRNEQGKCFPGNSVITTAGNLTAKYIIHTVGPIWHGGENGEADILRQAYMNSMRLAEKSMAQSIAFPSISTGAYGYPIEKAAYIAINTVREFLQENTKLNQVHFILFSDQDYNIYKKIIKETA